MVAANLPQLGESLGKVFATLGQAAPSGARSLELLFGAIEIVLAGFRGLITAATWANEALHGHYMSWDEVKKMYEGTPPVIDGVSTALGGLAGTGDAAAKALREAASAMLTARGDARGYEEAVDAASEALKQNGRTLDINTEKGRANQAALDQIVTSTTQWRDSLAASNRSVKDQNRVMEIGRAELIKTGIRFGLTRGQAEDYAASLLGIPKRTPTRAELDKRNAEATLAAWKRSLQATPRVVQSQATLSLPDLVIAAAMANRNRGQRTGGISHAAGGGPRGNLTWVGEDGPELLRLPHGSQVSSAPDSQRMAAQAGWGGAVTTVNVHFHGPVGSQRELEEWLLNAMRRVTRVNGGNVQQVIGA
jgi:hypothetical protein